MKKRILSIVLCICLLSASLLITAVAADSSAGAPFAGGSGSAEEPYLIKTAAQLTYLAERVNAGDAQYNAAHYLLTADIDLSGLAWIPIGWYQDVGFQGVFNGGYHTILGAYFVSTSLEEAYSRSALFCYLTGGTVKNLAFMGSTGGYHDAGGLVGTNDHGTILNCVVNVSVSADSIKGGAGGIVCENIGGTVANCCQVGYTSGSAGGGIAGSNHDGGKIMNCYALYGSGYMLRTRAILRSDETSMVEQCYMQYDYEFGGPAHYGGGENGPLFPGTSSGCASFLGTTGTLVPLDGSDPDDLPDDMIGGATTLLSALNAWVDAQQQGEYAKWVQLPGAFPTLSGFLTQAEETQACSMANFVSAGTYSGYSDVSESAWYGTEHEGSVRDATALGLFIGDGKGTFRPDDGIRLCEVVKIAAVIRNIYFGGQYQFDQSIGERWWSTYLSYAVTRGIISSRDFPDLNQYATRAQMAYVLAHALPDAELPQVTTAVPPDQPVEGMAFTREIDTLYQAGVLKGSDALGTFNGDTGITRAEAAAIIVRLALPDRRITAK